MLDKIIPLIDEVRVGISAVIVVPNVSVGMIVPAFFDFLVRQVIP